MKDSSQLEKYLKNEPLTPELERLAQGQDEADPIPQSDSRELSEDDREHLQRLSFEPGWPILIREVDRMIQAKEDAARAMSLSDPLTNRDQISNDWAYVSMLRKARNLFVSTLEVNTKRGQR
jgi:hypothetical protein